MKDKEKELINWLISFGAFFAGITTAFLILLEEQASVLQIVLGCFVLSLFLFVVVAALRSVLIWLIEKVIQEAIKKLF